MADQIFNVSCGFFDAINNDRTYSAEQMNNPYKRIVSNGVFAASQGTPSDDFQVIKSSGMEIIVKTGEGLFADKWFRNETAIDITVPNNTGLTPRLDSVIIQVDKRTSGRVGNIVYRTGTPASDPEPPAINTIDNVIEYRLANVLVGAGATSIGNEAITDLRGTGSCPWIKSLLYQSAFVNKYEKVVTLAASDSRTISLDMSGYTQSAFDTFLVYLNGLKGVPSVDYTIGTGSVTVNCHGDGDVVDIVVLQSVTGNPYVDGTDIEY